ncbi:Serine/threonine-protein kinase WNK [Zostera marina]|uniref:Serine/threonine-protein kinase WNK n=1 Tax=Zostera marina TaxID=29655 RepID=A0A0K9PLE0_ZOSMR|nr:Serine/threonine-protein kinase WNK [Zostera marina]
MEQQQVQYPLAVTHLLQQTLRSLCIHRNSQWVYAVFWRTLPRNYPPPKWDLPGSLYDRSRGNRRNWILVWEDGFCNFAASCQGHDTKGLRPELFFKMSHEIYNYGEGSIGKVASDHTHKWIFKEPQERGINFLSSWHNTADSHPRIWDAQFQSGIKTIALIAVKEGVVQLGALNKVVEDLSHVFLLRKRFSYLESIPGVLLPHPSSSAFPFKLDYAATTAASGCNDGQAVLAENWTTQTHPNFQPSMSSLEALLSKLPSVGASSSGITPFYDNARRRSSEIDHNLLVAKEEMGEGKQ